MTLTPGNLEELTATLTDGHARRQRVTGFNLAALNRVLEYTPEDMTVRVEAGITLAALQERLARSGQWLPIDPPHPAELSIGALIAANRSGPRRYAHGTIREHLIGIRVALADGRLVKAGGNVVKNVAGYDLCKLFVGSRGSLGVIVEATFKVQPLPETERFVGTPIASWEHADALLEPLLESPLTPAVLDLFRLSAEPEHSAEPTGPPAARLVLGFAGAQEDVDWQVALAGQLGVSAPADLDYEKGFWRDASDVRARRVSVLPTRVVETLRLLGDGPFVARAGNGVIYYRGGPEPPKEIGPGPLWQRIKDAYDPEHILPEPRA